MAVVRRNIVTTPTSNTAFIQGVTALKNEVLPNALTTADFGIPGTATKVRTYDLFVIWHYRAMMRPTPPGGSRNAAHSGPVFLPWHRFMLILLERHIQRVLGDPTFGLPYWDWAKDGDYSPAAQQTRPIWSQTRMGGNGWPVTSGPFRDGGGWVVRIEQNPTTGALRQANRGLRRAFSGGALPKRTDVAKSLTKTPYDSTPWSTTSAGFRNHVEGWAPDAGGRMHNGVHMWIQGDMASAASPNDPVFYLNHCNVDRIWAAWQQAHPGTPAQSYMPPQSAPSYLAGHRIDDDMYALISPSMKPRQMLNVSSTYSYDTLTVS